MAIQRKVPMSQERDDFRIQLKVFLRGEIRNILKTVPEIVHDFSRSELYRWSGFHRTIREK